MNVLVTGAGGFIGSHLTEKLVKQGHKVRAFVRYNSRNSWGWLESSEVKDDIEVYSGDIRDYDSVRASLNGIDVIFHLAALIGIPYSYRSPLAYIKTNIEGIYNVCQAAREAGVARLIHTSTSEVYGTAQYVPIDENHPLQAQSPYAASKIGADQLALSFYRSFGLPVTVIRPFNTYGPRQSARAVIPTIITQLLRGHEEIKLGNLTPTRDFNFVEDTVDGFITAGLSPHTVGEVINIGSGREISIGELAALLGKLIGVEVRIQDDPARYRPEASEVERLCCNNNKARELTGWQPKYSLTDGLKITIEWFKQHLELYKTGQYNV
ncbi:MAG: NAD-dependent epimerase/dehydratase [Thermacetogenium phaeum]|uniref:NAD-dependent epimerase/dehydratase n=1 Tax=Thermacetogenium phaeum TaxID=85874 RepID=A0A117LBL8_9THEO|nr:MAG: NAD-dependent epimerase/dehydratase [Thermacetogenium phaeum]